jgi:D-arabinose 1-dehydrogenase-like Zn-dependent alcohol dehydrogenase
MIANVNGMTSEQMLTPEYICSYAKEINQLVTKEIKKVGTNAKKDADVAEVQKFLEEKKITPEVVKSDWLPLQEVIRKIINNINNLLLFHTILI